MRGKSLKHTGQKKENEESIAKKSVSLRKNEENKPTKGGKLRGKSTATGLVAVLVKVAVVVTLALHSLLASSMKVIQPQSQP